MTKLEIIKSIDETTDLVELAELYKIGLESGHFETERSNFYNYINSKILELSNNGLWLIEEMEG